MTTRAPRAALAVLALAIVASSALSARAQEEQERKLGWTTTTEFSLVGTQGNSESTSLGLRMGFFTLATMNT